MKRLTRLISASIFLGLIFILLFSAYTSEAVKRSRRACSGLEIIIRDSLRNRFVDKADIEDCLISEFGDFKGKIMDSISLVSIEKAVDARSAVRKSEAYMTKDGILHISITQRKPVVRFQGKDAGIYADEEGCLSLCRNPIRRMSLLSTVSCRSARDPDSRVSRRIPGPGNGPAG